jgi:hypothetical protein
LEQQEEPKGIRKLIVPVLAGGAFLMGKAKYVLVALKLAKFMPLASMVLTSTKRDRETARQRDSETERQRICVCVSVLL